MLKIPQLQTLIKPKSIFLEHKQNNYFQSLLDCTLAMTKNTEYANFLEFLTASLLLQKQVSIHQYDANANFKVCAKFPQDRFLT